MSAHQQENERPAKQNGNGPLRDGETPASKPRKPLWRELLGWSGALLGAFLVAMVVHALLVQPVRVDGRSMDNTLKNGEVMLVTKPEVLLGHLNRGDVVVCRFPGRNKQLSLPLGAMLGLNVVNHTLFVKRLVALPGDAVQISNGVLYINDQPVEEPYVDFPARMDYPRRVMDDNQYMVMGDNRAGSHDSRARDVGPITKDMIVGRPRLVVAPLSSFRVIH